jgi:hypothetical protein
MRNIRRIHVPRPRLSYGNVAATMALVLAMSGFAVAAIPSRDGQIRACYKTRGGAVRLVDTTRCRRGERAISWSQTGRPGAAGPVGAAGAAGPGGPAGPAGPAGAAGRAGRDGVDGADGADGADGTDATFVGTPAGGDLAGTYPNPSIGANAVDGAAVADRSLTAADVTKANTTMTVNPPNVPANDCAFVVFPAGAPTLDGGDVVSITPTDLPNRLVVQEYGIAGSLQNQIGFFRICNVSGSAIDPGSAEFHITVVGS